MEPTCWRDYGAFQVLWGGAASWLAQNYYEYYKYTEDMDFLKNRAFPFMKSCAEFYLQLLRPDCEGKLHMYISASPENFPEDGGLIIDTATMDIALIRELFSNLMEADGILGLKSEEAIEWQNVIERLVDYPIDQNGTLLEWCDARAPRDLGHRHLSHIYPLFPGKECYTDSKLKEAALRALERRLSHNVGQSAAWSYVWYSCCFARIGDIQREQECMENLLIGSIISKLLTFLGNGANAMIALEVKERKYDLTQHYLCSNKGHLRQICFVPSCVGYGSAGRIIGGKKRRKENE